MDYTLNNKTVGKIGVIGPKRMDYSKVIGMITQLANAIDSTFGGRGLLGDGDNEE